MATQALQRRVDAALREVPFSFLHPEIKAMYPYLSPRTRRILSGRGNRNDIEWFWYSLPQDLRDRAIKILYPDDDV